MDGGFLASLMPGGGMSGGIESGGPMNSGMGGGFLSFMPGMNVGTGAGMGGGLMDSGGGMMGGMGGGMGWMGMLGSMINMGGQAAGGGDKTTSQVTGGLGGALSGAQMGSSFGPWGMAAGAIIGGLIGAFSNAEGGIQPQSTTGGGIVTKPVSLMQFGEKAPGELEAVVPLPNNRSIPVTLSGKMPYNPEGGGKTGYGTSASKAPPPIVHVEMLGDMVNPASKGMTPDEAIHVWIEDYNRGGKVRDVIHGDRG
jgi:hypothetical protein